MVVISVNAPDGSHVPLNGIKIASYWNRVEGKPGGKIKFARVGDALRNRPETSEYLCCTFYDRDIGQRYIGKAIIPAQSMSSGSPVTAQIVRAQRQHHPSVTISEYAALRTGVTIGSEIRQVLESERGMRFDVVDMHNAHYRDHPLVTQPEYSYYKWPLWPNGALPMPGWKFAHTDAITASSPSFYEKCLNIAIERENIGANPNAWSSEDLAAAAIGTLTAYPTSTNYRQEADPLLPGRPSESFRAMRLSGRGDCEDAAWEICNAKRELAALRNAGLSPGLQKVKAHLDNYAEFMTLVSATAGQADTVGRSSGSQRQAHMMALFLPRHQLAELGMQTEGPKMRGLPTLLGEGTGRVYPIQTIGSSLPKCMTARGHKWQNEMITVEKTDGIKRIIHAPPTADTGYTVVGDFYIDVITAYNHETGLVDFRDNDSLGYGLAKIIAGDVDNLRLVSVPGTKLQDETVQDKKLMSVISGFSEPILAFEDDANGPAVPISAAVLFARRNFPQVETPRGTKTHRDATLLLPFQVVNTEDEMSFIAFLKRNEMRIAEMEILTQPVADTGAYQFNITLK